jgi:hypothetical protein
MDKRIKIEKLDVGTTSRVPLSSLKTEKCEICETEEIGTRCKCDTCAGVLCMDCSVSCEKCDKIYCNKIIYNHPTIEYCDMCDNMSTCSDCKRECQSEGCGTFLCADCSYKCQTCYSYHCPLHSHETKRDGIVCKNCLIEYDEDDEDDLDDKDKRKSKRVKTKKEEEEEDEGYDYEGDKDE